MIQPRVTIATPEEPAPRASTSLTHRAKTRRNRPARAHSRTGRQDLGRDHRRRRAQRPGLRGLSGARRQARAGPRSRQRVGGACTIEEPLPGVRMSPCAYLAGLLHPLVVEELELPARGFRWTPAVNGLFVPFHDGSSVQLWDDDDRCEAEIRTLRPGDVEGWRAMCARHAPAPRCAAARRRRCRRISGSATRPRARRSKSGSATTRKPARLLFDWSMVEFVEHYLRRRAAADRLPRPGRHRHQRQPLRPGHGLDPLPPRLGPAGRNARHVGLRRGRHGHGLVLLLRRRARGRAPSSRRRAGRRRSFPAKASLLEGGERIAAPVVVSNADPRRTLATARRRAPTRPGARASKQFPSKAARSSSTSCSRELPNFTARPGTNQPHHYGQINTPLTKDEWKAGFAAARRGELPEHLWSELYFQSVHDPTVAPRGHAHHERLRAVRAVHVRRTATWDSRRDEVRDLALDSIGRFCSNIDTDAVIDAQVLGPPDIEQKVGLTGGHIFQGECLPPYMWDKPPHRAHADARRLPLRRLHASRRQRDRHQRPQRRDGRSRRHESPSNASRPPPIAACERRTPLADLAAPPLPSPASGKPGSPTLKRSLRFRDLTLFYVVTILSIRWIATAAAAGPGTLVVWVARAPRLLPPARRQRPGAGLALSRRRRPLRLDARSLRRRHRLPGRLDLLDVQPALLSGHPLLRRWLRAVCLRPPRTLRSPPALRTTWASRSSGSPSSWCSTSAASSPASGSTTSARSATGSPS